MDTVIHERVQTIPQEIIDGFQSLGVGDIGHVQNYGFMDTSIRPIWRDIKLVGTAVTVRMPNMTSSISREAIRAAQSGDVIVIDRGGDTEIAGWGGFVSLLAKAKGIAGLIVDGAVTDTMEITDLKWPVYSRSISGIVGRPGGAVPGEINTTVSCGGVPVSPGDLIVADDDGIVVIRPHEAEKLLRAVQERYKNIPNIREWIRSGKSIQDYPNVREFLEQS